MLSFVPLEEAYLPAILEIENKVHGAPWSEKSFRNEIDHPYGVFRVALLKGEVVGYAGLWLLVDESHVTTVAVHPNYRRQGIGRKLTIEILLIAKERQISAATLEVRAGNQAAITMYEKLGFESVAVRKKYYPDNQEDAIVMWLYGLQAWNPR